MNPLPDSHASYDSSAPWWQQRAAWLYAALVSGVLSDHTSPDRPRRDLSVRLEALGSLLLPRGRLVIADPYLMEGNVQPVEQSLDLTAYEVVHEHPSPQTTSASRPPCW